VEYGELAQSDHADFLFAASAANVKLISFPRPVGGTALVTFLRYEMGT